jgi:hypothetical protein
LFDVAPKERNVVITARWAKPQEAYYRNTKMETYKMLHNNQKKSRAVKTFLIKKGGVPTIRYTPGI